MLIFVLADRTRIECRIGIIQFEVFPSISQLFRLRFTYIASYLTNQTISKDKPQPVRSTSELNFTLDFFLEKH